MEATILIGIDIKNENPTATFLGKLHNKPADIVEADLDIPGINDIHWNSPILKAILKFISSKSLILLIFLFFFSEKSIKKDPNNR
jgi:hypothetical protein